MKYFSSVRVDILVNLNKICKYYLLCKANDILKNIVLVKRLKSFLENLKWSLYSKGNAHHFTRIPEPPRGLELDTRRPSLPQLTDF